MVSTALQIQVAGQWLSTETLYGDVEMSTIWPGGSDQLSWTPGALSAYRYRGGEDVRAYLGPVCVWCGSLLEPDPSQEQLTATGAFREAAGFAALDSGVATDIPDDAIDRAIGAGLRWTRPASIKSTSIKIDISQGPVFLDTLLDTWAANNVSRWGVDTQRNVYGKTDDNFPTYSTSSLNGGLGYALDGYASTLIGRFFSTDTSDYDTVTVTDAQAEADHGHVEQVVDLTPRGPLSVSTATDLLQSLLDLGAAVPRWTSGMEFAYGEILTPGGTPVALETVAAGHVLRVHGGFDLAQRLNGQMYLDVPIGRTNLSDGTLKVDPAQLAVRTLADFVASTPAA